MEQVGCIHFTYEPRSYDYPGSVGCTRDHCTDDFGRFGLDITCEECGEDHGCGPDCPGFEVAA